MLTSTRLGLFGVALLGVLPSAPRATAAGPTCDYDDLTGVCRISVTEEKDWTPPRKGKPARTSRVATKSSCRLRGRRFRARRLRGSGIARRAAT